MHSPKAKTKKESCHGCHVARMIPSDALEESGKGGGDSDSQRPGPDGDGGAVRV